MANLAILGGGAIARDCCEVLSRAGFAVHRTFELEAADRSPLILGEVPGFEALALRAVETGRHVLLAGPGNFDPGGLAPILPARQPGQALFVWSGRLRHPAYEKLRALLTSDSSLRPRQLRVVTLCREPPRPPGDAWRLAETAALLFSMVPESPEALSAAWSRPDDCESSRFVAAAVHFQDCSGVVQAAFAEPVERRETVVACGDRSLLVDELSSACSLQVVEPGGIVRRLRCDASGSLELARRQLLAFLEATRDAAAAGAEAELWRRALAALRELQRQRPPAPAEAYGGRRLSRLDVAGQAREAGLLPIA